MDLARVIEKIPVFRDLSPYQVQQFLRACRSKTYQAGQALCRAGEQSGEMYVVISGALAIITPEEVELARIGPGATVGEMGLVTNTPRCATILAMTSVNVLVIGRGQFAGLMKEDADMGMKIYHNLLLILVSRLRETNQYMARSRQEAAKSETDWEKQLAASTV